MSEVRIELESVICASGFTETGSDLLALARHYLSEAMYARARNTPLRRKGVLELS